MPKKYRRYQHGGPLGGIKGLAKQTKDKVKRDLKRSEGTEDTTRALMEFAEEGGLNPRDRASMDLEREYPHRSYDMIRANRRMDRNRNWNDEIARLTLQRLLGREVPEELLGAVSEVQQEFPTRRFLPDEWEGLQDAGRQQEQKRSGIIGLRGPVMRSGGVVGLRGGGQVRMVYNNGQLIPAYGFGDWIKKWGGKAAKGLMKVAPMAVDLLPFGGTAKSIISGVAGLGSGLAEGQGLESALEGGVQQGLGSFLARKAADDPEWARKNYPKIRAMEKLAMGHAGGAGGPPSTRMGVQVSAPAAKKATRAPSETITRLTGPASSKYNLFDELRGKARGGIIGLQEGGDVRQGLREPSPEEMEEMSRRHRARYKGKAQVGGPGPGQDPWSMWQQQQQRSDPRFGPGTLASAAGSGSRSDPFLGDPAGLADYRRQQQGQQGAVHPSQRPPQGPPQGQPAGGGGPAGAGTGGYRPQALPEGYGGPQAYAGYGMPAEMGVRQEFVSPEVASQYADIKEGIMQAGTRPWEDVRYKGPHLAGFTDMEAAYQAGIGALGTGEGPQGTRQAEATIGEAARGIGQAAAAAGTPELEREADLSQYMSQYTSGVTDPKLAKLREFQQEQAQELGSQAAGAGAFGGYRQGVMEGQQRQDVAQQAADIIGADQEAAFKSAQAAFARDVATGAGARGQQMDAYGQLLGAGGQQAALGGQQQAEEMARLDAMRRAGMSQRELQQAGIDVAKEQHELGVQHPEKQLSWMTGMLGQLPYQNIVQTAGYQPQMGPASTMMGAGMQGEGWQSQYEAAQPRTNTLDWASGTGPGTNTGPQYENLPQPGGGTPPPVSPISGGIGQGGPAGPSWGDPTPNLGAPGTVGPITGPGPAPAWTGYAGGIIGVGRGMGR